MKTNKNRICGLVMVASGFMFLTMLSAAVYAQGLIPADPPNLGKPRVVIPPPLVGACDLSPLPVEMPMLQPADPAIDASPIDLTNRGPDPKIVQGKGRVPNRDLIPGPSPKTVVDQIETNPKHPAVVNSPSLVEIADQMQAAIDASRNINARLENCDSLRERMVWRQPDNTELPYEDWPDDWKNRLNSYYRQFVRGTFSAAATCPVPGDVYHQGRTYYQASEALELYLTHVAHALYVETENRVPWKLADEAPTQIDQFMASDSYFVPIKPSDILPNDYYPADIASGFDYQLPREMQDFFMHWCNPQDGYHIARGLLASQGRHLTDDLLGDSQVQTLANLSAWTRDWFIHDDHKDPLPLGQQLAILDLIERIRPQTTESGNTAIFGYRGCHGAAATFKQIAHSLNIPLLIVDTGDSFLNGRPLSSATHAGLCWRWDQSQARCLPTIDSHIAYGDQELNYPAAPGGEPILGEERALNYWNAHWRPLGELTAWGLPVVMEKQVLGVNYFPPIFVNGEVGYHELSTLLGWWQTSDREQNSIDNQILNGKGVPIYGNDLMNRWSAYTQFQFSGWKIVDAVCRNDQNYLVNRVASYGSLAVVDGLGPPVWFSFPELTQVGQASALAYALPNPTNLSDFEYGCAQIRADHDDWLQQRIFQ